MDDHRCLASVDKKVDLWPVGGRFHQRTVILVRELGRSFFDWGQFGQTEPGSLWEAIMDQLSGLGQ
jgi:hypothetical protein